MAALGTTENTFPPLFDVVAVWAMLWQRRLTVLVSIGGAIALALIYLAVTTPTYTATASLLIDPRDTRSTQFEAVLPGIGADSAAVASQVFVIESRDLLMAVFESEGIERDAEFADDGLLSFLTRPDDSGKDMIFRRFERRVSVERAGLTYVIEVSFKSRSAEKAARIANAIVERYTVGLAREREAANSDVNTRLAARIASLRENVTDAERAVGAFKIEHDIVDPAAGGTLQSQIDQLTAQMIEARAGADQAKGRYDQAMSAGGSAAALARLPEIVSSTAIDRLRADYNQRAASLANAEAVYQSRHPSIRRLRSELDRTSALMTAEAARVTREMKAKYDLSIYAVSSLEAKLAALRGRSQAADAAQVELRRLEATSQAARTVLDDVLKRAQETSQMRGLQMSEARVISVAAPPSRPTWPTPMLLLPVSAALGLLAGCGLVMARGPLDRPGDGVAGPVKVASHGRAADAVTAPIDAAQADLGHYALPGLPGASAPSRIRAMRRRFLQRGGEAFSQTTFKLVRRIIARLDEHPAPYVLLVAAVKSSAEAKLACAMIGMGLQQAGQNVLVVECGGQPHPGELNAGVFINGASGLPTIVRAFNGGKDGWSLAREQGLAGDFDFVLLLAPPLIDHAWEPTLLEKADLTICALAEPEDAAEAGALLPQRLGADGAARSVTLVIAMEEAATAGAVVSLKGAAR
jgi:uncharacterized protein involved in exopolysaccharide biosynthesis